MDIQIRKAALYEKLQKAIELELSTIPPYLTAMFSIKQGKNVEASSIIRSVLMEEMLHMVLAANILSATGGTVCLGKENIPSYPCRLEFKGKDFKNREFDIHLAALSPDTINTFMQIELPEGWEAVKFLKARIEIPGYTIGEFYNSIKDDLKQLSDAFGEVAVFSGNPEFQISEQYFWGGGGRPIVVTNLATAYQAIDLIVEQGEGTSGSIYDHDEKYFLHKKDVAHYFRFNEIYQRRYYRPTDKPQDSPSGDVLHVDYNDVYPIKTDCKSSDFTSQPQIKALNDKFNSLYSLMLHQLEEGFKGNPKVFYTAIMNGMKGLTPIALNMVQLPIAGDIENRHASPSFEWMEPDVFIEPVDEEYQKFTAI